MYDDDRDALAAEYVLGTLSAEEREQAEALLAIDHGFGETVRLWEHRLGELNVMVEAVEPPADLWERIKGDIGGGGGAGPGNSPSRRAGGRPGRPCPPPARPGGPPAAPPPRRATNLPT